MSAIGGIFNFDHRPVDWGDLIMLSDSLARRGPDGGDVIIDGPVGTCYRAFHTNRESRLERQPFVSRSCILTLDGRIDNRKELITSLRNHLQSEITNITDVEIVMAAFSQWGDGFVRHLVGEFALMLWDPTSRTVLLARDHIGARTLYYYKDKERLIWSSELEPLIDVAGVSLEINHEYIAGYLAYDPEPELTPYKKFHAVKPFHAVSVALDGRLQSWRYWGLDETKKIRYSKDEEYEEDFYHQIKDAVRGPLRSDLPVFADLSGGLDSSAIVCVADQVLADGDVAAPALETISQVSDGSPTSDERKFIRHVEAQRGRQGHHIREEDRPLLRSLSVENASVSLNPLLFCAEQHRGAYEVMQAGNGRVLLSGTGGDEIMCSSPDPSPELGDLLTAGHLVQVHNRLKEWSRYLKKPYAEVLWRNVLVPVFPRSIRVRYQPTSAVPAIFGKEFSRQILLRERLFAPADPFDCSLPSDRDQALGFWTAIRGIASGYRREASGVDVSYPFLHRPLVEFMQAIPHQQRVRIGETRSLMRRSLKGVLPEKILKRKSKGNPQEVLSRAVAREWPRLESLFIDARVCAYGFIDLSALQSTIEGFRHCCGTHSPALVKTLVLEVWLRALERRGASVKQAAGAGKEHILRPAVVQARVSSVSS